MKKLMDVQKEKEKINKQVDEENHLAASLTKQLEQVKREKVELEQQLGQSYAFSSIILTRSL